MEILHVGDKGTPQYKMIVVMDERELDDLENDVKRYERIGFDREDSLYKAIDDICDCRSGV